LDKEMSKKYKELERILRNGQWIYCQISIYLHL
jgi:hypothetical protein